MLNYAPLWSLNQVILMPLVANGLNYIDLKSAVFSSCKSWCSKFSLLHFVNYFQVVSVYKLYRAILFTLHHTWQNLCNLCCSILSVNTIHHSWYILFMWPLIFPLISSILIVVSKCFSIMFSIIKFHKLCPSSSEMPTFSVHSLHMARLTPLWVFLNIPFMVSVSLHCIALNTTITF